MGTPLSPFERAVHEKVFTSIWYKSLLIELVAAIAALGFLYWFMMYGPALESPFADEAVPTVRVMTFTPEEKLSLLEEVIHNSDEAMLKIPMAEKETILRTVARTGEPESGSLSAGTYEEKEDILRSLTGEKDE